MGAAHWRKMAVGYKTRTKKVSFLLAVRHENDVVRFHLFLFGKTKSCVIRLCCSLKSQNAIKIASSNNCIGVSWLMADTKVKLKMVKYSQLSFVKIMTVLNGVVGT